MAADLRLPYADQFSQLSPPRSPPKAPRYVNYDSGRMPCRHQWLPPSGQFGGTMNSLTYGLRISTQDMKVAIPYILGFATSAGTFFNRELPIADPDGFGMCATGLSIRGYQGPTGLIKLEIPTDTGTVDGPAPGDNQIYNDTVSAFFDYSLGIPSGTQKVADLFRYVILNVTFEHAMYWRASDDVITSDELGERDRFTIWNYVAGIEYVSLDSNTLTWVETAAGGPPLYTTVGKGAGFVRATGELKGTWYNIPADTIEILIQKWFGMGSYPPTTTSFLASGYPVAGRTNIEDFTVDLTNFDGLVTFPAQTLLFQPPRLSILPNPMGFRNYNVEMSLTHRPETWTRFLHWPSGRYFTCAFPNQTITLPIPPGVLPDPTLFRPVYGLADFEGAFIGA